VTGLVIVCYFVLPLSSGVTTTTALFLLAGLLGLCGLLVWHLRSILRSPYPRVRAVTALATTVPMFLVLFATAYYTITVFATVGFGDITPITQSARAATTLQMIGDVILVGLVAQVIVGAMRRGVRRQEEARDGQGLEAQKPVDRL
jgi:hypothetical protein